MICAECGRTVVETTEATVAQQIETYDAQRFLAGSVRCGLREVPSRSDCFVGMTRAMEAGTSDHVWSLEEIAELAQ